MKEIIHAPGAPAAIGPYSHAVKSGGFLFLSGQIPLDPATGKLVEGDITAQTRQVLENIKAVLDAAGLTIGHVVKNQVFLADFSDFAAMNAVYAEVFSENPPARSCFAVSTLPAGARVEIESLAVLD